MAPPSACVFYAMSQDPHQCVDADVRALAEHLRRCLRGRWFSLQCHADSVRAFTGPRFMSCVLTYAAIVMLGAATLG